MSVHILPTRNYIFVFLARMVLTAATVWAAFHSWGPWNDVVAMGIAAVKASLVVLIFMHVRYSTRLTWLVVLAGILWLGIFFLLIFSDYLTRVEFLGVAGK